MNSQGRNKNLNVPNLLTVLRCILVIPLVYYFMDRNYIAALVVLAVSGLTDMLDGWIARQFHQFTELGQMLDPLSDKLTQAAIAICFSIREPILIPLLAVFVVKEVLMIAGAIKLISKNKKKPSGSQWYGKVATVLFYLSFGVIFALSIWGKGDYFVADVTLLSVTAAFMIYAFVRYAKIYFKTIRSDDPKYNLDIKEVMDTKKKS
jgi:cardiolipin synthase